MRSRSRFRVRRWLLAITAFTAAGLAFAAAGLVVNAWLGPHQKPQAFPPTCVPGAALGHRSVVPATAAPGRPALASPVRVVPGTDEVDGVSLGYPHTLLTIFNC